MVADERRVSAKKSVVEKEVQPRVENTSGYYLAPTKDTPAQSKQKSQSASVDVHVYKNNTLNGKANAVYEVGIGDGVITSR